MNRIVALAITIGFCCFYNVVLSQNDSTLLINLKAEQYALNKDSVLSKISPLEEGIIMFCPNNYKIADSLYEFELKDIRESDRLDSNVAVLGILYKNMNSSAKNPRIDTITISEMDCFLVLKDSVLLRRALDLFPEFTASNLGLPEHMYSIRISDKIACPKNLAAKILLYQSFLFEVFDPQYTKQEQIDQLRNEIKVTNIKQEEDIKTLLHQIEILNKKIIELDKKKRDKK